MPQPASAPIVTVSSLHTTRLRWPQTGACGLAHTGTRNLREYRMALMRTGEVCTIHLLVPRSCRRAGSCLPRSRHLDDKDSKSQRAVHHAPPAHRQAPVQPRRQRRVPRRCRAECPSPEGPNAGRWMPAASWIPHRRPVCRGDNWPPTITGCHVLLPRKAGAAAVSDASALLGPSEEFPREVRVLTRTARQVGRVCSPGRMCTRAAVSRASGRRA